ncbi:hypothetical protein C8R46DRAFT_1047366 [Mycena filopes]|nr:hypothetical protein C8R46DRAFT_1047366 [Mycena filopes]
MGKGQFNSAQNQWLSAQLPAYIKELDAGVRGAQLTKWKQATARRALDAPEFSDLDFSQFDRTKWFLMIVRKYTNYQNQVYDKEHPAVPSASAIIKANPLLKFSSRLTGRQLFARDLHSDIVTGSKQRVADEGTNEAAAYQIVLKTMWDELDDEQRADWEAKAEDECGDVALNQKEFDGNIFLALRGLCEGGLFGDAEMLLLYAFREPDTGDLTAGRQPPLGPPKHQVTIITLNNGAVIFPRIDLDTIPLGSLRYLLGEYLQMCWSSLSSKDHSSGTSGGAANKANKRKRQSNRGTGDGKNAGEDSGKPKKKSKTKAVAVDNQGESAGVRRSSRVVPKADNKASTSDQAGGATKKKQRWKGWVEVEESEDTD